MTEQPIKVIKRTHMEENISVLENHFFRLAGCPMAICSGKTGALLSVNAAMELQLGKYFYFELDQLTFPSRILQI
jgi:hypothetical protein